MKDRITFVKRMSGLISYYRGSKEELMPKVVNDTIVECKLSTVALPQYEKARLKEIETEKTKKSSKKSAFDEAMDLAQSESSSSEFSPPLSLPFFVRLRINIRFDPEWAPSLPA